MNVTAMRDYVFILISLMLGMVLALIPMPEWAVWLRPNWVLAILVFWLIVAPHRVGIGFCWIVGLFMDLLTGTVLGQQALIYCLTAYFVLKFQYWLAHMPILQQTAMILLLMLFDITIERCLLIVFQHSIVNWLFWLPAITTAVIWPWLSGLLYIYQMKARVADLG